MFKCESCASLREALAYERERNKEIMDRLMALADARAYQAVKFESESDSTQYFGGDDDVEELRNEFGEKILVRKNERPV